jgi:hypothetical protein
MEAKMAQVIEYKVKLIPATISPEGYTGFQLFDPNTKYHAVTATSLVSLEGHVRALAKAFGQTCAIYVTVQKGQRKPPGFDSAVRKFETIKFVPDEEKAA